LNWPEVVPVAPSWLVRYPPMTERGHDRRATGRPGRSPHRPSSNNGGYDARGELTEGPDLSVRRAEDDEPRVANEAGLTALAEEMYRPHGGRSDRRRKAGQSRRRRRVKRGVLIGLAIVLVIVGGAAGYAYYLAHDLQRVEVKGLNGALSTGAEAGSENILMVGSTSRCALKVQNPNYGICSQGVNGVNSDVMMILHADPAHHRLALLSIPRDLFVPNARSDGANKIDAGLYQGLTQVVAAIEEDFGIPIQHAVSLNFDQFANVVDALGGINMSFPMSVFDWGGAPPPNGIGSSGLNVQAATCVHLNGTQALQVVRSRELRYKAPGDGSDPYYWTAENQSDLARIRRDHEFLRVLATAVAKQGLSNPITDLSLINSVKSDLTFDQAWPVGDMVSLVRTFHSVNIGSVPQLTLPVAQGTFGTYYYKGGGPYGEIEFPAQGQDQTAVDQVLGISANIDSMTGKALPPPSSVSVSVVNGTGVTNQAADTSTALGALGFKMVGLGDATPVGKYAETVVYYGSRAPAVEAAAEAVARSMTGAVIMGYDPTQVTNGAQVTVVTGTQFAVNPPPTASTPTSAPTGSTATTAGSTGGASGTSGVGAGFTPPTTTTQNLQPWDPRACAAGATPTAPVANPLPG
jgi:LCP family protein required for cell wall assembly